MPKSCPVSEAEDGTQPSPAYQAKDGPGTHDAVFGDLNEEGPKYRNVGWLGAVALMMKSMIGVGVLSIPGAFDRLGLVPGLICLIGFAAITSWSEYMVGVFKRRHPDVYSIDDAGALMFGRVGREVFGIAYCLFWIFVAGSAMLGISIGLNAISSHGACTAIFVAVAAIIGFICASIRTLARISWLAWVGIVCILSAILVVTVAVAVEDRPASAPQQGPWTSDYKIVASPSLAQTLSAMSAILFSLAGTPAFFAIQAEMRDPRHYTRSLLICQTGTVSTYITIGTVVYYYCGSYVASPALGSAGATMKKVAYGLALPGLLATTTISLHMPAKYAFIRVLRGSRHLVSNGPVHWATWISCTLGTTIIAYLIASGIPDFENLVSLIGALIGTLLTLQSMGCAWLYDNWSQGRAEPSLRWYLMATFAIFVVVAGTFLMVGGTYGSVVAIIDSYKQSGGSAAWTCADTSNST